MDERVEKWLYDIRFAIEEIDGYFENSGIDFTAFKQTKHDVETRNRKKSRNHR